MVYFNSFNIEVKMKNVVKGSLFEMEVEQILQLRGYKVIRNNLINGTQVDLHATKNDPLDNISFVVECADREGSIGIDLVKEKSAILLSLKDEEFIYRLMFVSKNGFTAEAKAFAKKNPNLLLLTMTELENLLVNLLPYVNSFLHNYEHSLGMFKDANLINNYVELSARDEKKSLILSIDYFLRDWLKSESNNLLFLLGDYGSGKTSFCRHFVYKFLKEKYIQRLDTKYTPILMNLRDVRGKLELKKLVTDTLVQFYGVELPSYAAFEKLCATGNIILVLDGFDEMSDRSDSQTLIDSFNQIYLLAALDIKIILTCRSNFFRSHEDIINLLKRFSISIPIDDQNKILEFSLAEQGHILYLEKFNEDQIREFIEKRLKNNAEEMIGTIKKIHDLSDLSTRPVLLDMIVSSLPELQKAKNRINSAALYSHYTDRWSTRDQWRVTIPLDIRKTFCETLAWVMHCANITEIPFEILEKTMIGSLNAVTNNPEQLEKFKNDIQTCSFLVRTGSENEFRFAHKSFVEFFFARKLVNNFTSGIPIEKPDMDDWFPGYKKNLFYLDGVYPSFFENHKIMMLDYFRNSINDRFHSLPTFHAFQIAELSGKFHSIPEIGSYLESEIQAIFRKQMGSSFSQDIIVSEEIATFVIEHLSNLSVNLKTVISRLEDQGTIDVFCDVLRLAPSSEWINQNSKTLKEYLNKGTNDNLKIACISSLLKYPSLIDLKLIRSVREKISERGWSYVLFEIASSINDYEKIITNIVQNDNLKPIDQAICLSGLSGRFPADEKGEKLRTLVTDLMMSKDENERDLALKVCYALPEKERLLIISNAFKKIDSKAFKKVLIQLLQEYTEKDSWKIFRSLAFIELDPEVKRLLYEAEQVLRNISSSQKSRSGWSHVNGSKAIRESIWKWPKEKRPTILM